MPKPKNPKTFSVTEEEFREYREDYIGICLNCGATVDGCEPDTRDAECGECGEPRVHGIEEALIMGRIEIG